MGVYTFVTVVLNGQDKPVITSRRNHFANLGAVIITLTVILWHANRHRVAVFRIRSAWRVHHLAGITWKAIYVRAG